MELKQILHQHWRLRMDLNGAEIQVLATIYRDETDKSPVDKAQASQAHPDFCEKAYGLDLCQEGQMDMDSLRDLLGRLDLKAGRRSLCVCQGRALVHHLLKHGSKITGRVARPEPKKGQHQLTLILSNQLGHQS
jgi:hypothetical protein